MRASLTFIFAIALLASFNGAAQTVRVAARDLGVKAGREESALVQETAQELKKLSPDVVLLRHVSGWKMCSQLAAALKPAEYRVVVCSTFNGPGNNNGTPIQVAILARSSAYFSWAESWKAQKEGASADGGFAFVAVQVAGHRFGFSCVELPGGTNVLNEQAAQQWLNNLKSFRGWANNRLEGFVAAVSAPVPKDGETGRLLREAGFSDPLAGKAQVWVGESIEAHLVPSADSPSGLMLQRWPINCDFDFRPAPIVIVAENPAPPPMVVAVPPTTFSGTLVWMLGSVGLLALAAIGVLLLQIRRRLGHLQQQGALTVSTVPYNLAIAAPEMSGNEMLNLPAALPTQVSQDQNALLKKSLFEHLSQWFKHAFVQRLVSDRARLMATEKAATKGVLAVDERLARLEIKINKENFSYEKQIEQLSRELLTAREENLELIRSQINLLKAEMESARGQVEAESREIN